MQNVTFKVGDRIRVKSTSNLNPGNTGKIKGPGYTKDDYEIELDGHFSSGFSTLRFFYPYTDLELLSNVPAPQYPSKFNIGDHVKVVNMYNSQNFGLEGIVTSVNAKEDLYGVELLNHVFKAFELELISKEQARVPSVATCSCSSRDLFHKGCTCGAVKRVARGLGA